MYSLKLLNFLVTVIIVFLSGKSYCQLRDEEISTDSSDIVIIRNSEYKIYEETYKNKDSIWCSVRFIKDTSQINTEGWQTKSGKYLGKWNEYTIVIIQIKFFWKSTGVKQPITALEALESQATIHSID